MFFVRRRDFSIISDSDDSDETEEFDDSEESEESVESEDSEESDNLMQIGFGAFPVASRASFRMRAGSEI